METQPDSPAPAIDPQWKFDAAKAMARAAAHVKMEMSAAPKDPLLPFSARQETPAPTHVQPDPMLVDAASAPFHLTDLSQPMPLQTTGQPYLGVAFPQLSPHELKLQSKKNLNVMGAEIFASNNPFEVLDRGWNVLDTQWRDLLRNGAIYAATNRFDHASVQTGDDLSNITLPQARDVSYRINWTVVHRSF